MRRLPLAIAAALVAARQAPAQEPPSSRDDAVCLGFAFGEWTPKLDWKAAGHAVAPPRDSADRAPGGRDWASSPDAGATDSTLMLFPRWWPVGVVVTLPTRAPAAGDTVTGRAVALVPRFDTEAPTTRVRAWRVACRR
jgi:hypothetical protein